MKRTLIALLFAGFFAVALSAQDSNPNASNLGVNTAQQRLQEVSISKFEDPGFWVVTMPLDHGIIEHRRFEGAPANKRPLEAEEATAATDSDDYVLGVKTQYYRRGWTSLSIQAARPLAVPGIAKTISLWVVGRNFNHMLKVIVEDYFGNKIALPMGRLNFSGWKEMTVAVPPSIQQINPHHSDRSGIKILGFVIEPELTETYGTYYVYFDDLRVVTDLFAEESRDPDDMVDAW